jgi:hypothetical protein
MMYLVPIIAIVLGIALGYVLGHRGRYWYVLAGVGAGAAGFAWCVWQGQRHTGWDGIGYAIFAMLIIMPSVGGLLIGTLAGWVRRLREARAVG